MTRYFRFEITSTDHLAHSLISTLIHFLIGILAHYRISTLANYRISTLPAGAFLFCLLLFIGNSLHAQTDSVPPVQSNLESPVRWLLVEKSFGVVPEIDFINGAMGLSVCRGKFIRGTQRAIAGNGYYVGYAYDTQHQISLASFGGWIGMFRRKFGGQVGLRGVYYVNRSMQVFAIRPEAGIGFVKAQLSYGYTIVTEKKTYALPTHTLTLSVYFSTHSTRTQMY